MVVDELAELHTSPNEVARALQVPAQRIEQLIAEKSAMAADLALRLERWSG